MKRFAALTAAFLTFALGGCISVPGAGISSATDIARDATALNDAYSRAITIRS